MKAFQQIKEAPAVEKYPFAYRWDKHIASYEFVRLREIGEDEVLVTYECERTDGSRFRNTEVLTFAGSRIAKVEVYFGWDL